MTDDEIGTKVLAMFEEAWTASGGRFCEGNIVPPNGSCEDGSPAWFEASHVSFQIPAEQIRTEPANGWDTVRVKVTEVVKRLWRWLGNADNWTAQAVVFHEWNGKPFFALRVELHEVSPAEAPIKWEAVAVDYDGVIKPVNSLTPTRTPCSPTP